MKIKIENHEESNVRIIEYPFSVLDFVNIHFVCFGIYRIAKHSAGVYHVFNAFDGSHIYTVSKARAADPVGEWHNKTE